MGALVLAPTAARPDEAASRRELRTVLFGSLDAGRSFFTSTGVKRALGPSLDRSGFILKGVAGVGAEVEKGCGCEERTRAKSQGALLAGYQWFWDRTVVSISAGPEIDYEQVLPDHGAKLPRPRIGGRLQAELCSHPTDATLLTATFIAGSAREHVWGRVSAGLRVWRDVYVGPEVAAYATEDYREWRIGAHVTGLSLGRHHFRLSGGWRREADDGRQGAYAGLTYHTRR